MPTEADSEQWRQYDARLRRSADFARVPTEAEPPTYSPVDGARIPLHTYREDGWSWNSNDS